MLRTLGFLAGVGLSIAGFLLVLEPAELLEAKNKATTLLAQLRHPHLDAPAPRPANATPAKADRPAQEYAAPQQPPPGTTDVARQDAADEMPVEAPAAAVTPQASAESAADPASAAPESPSGTLHEHLFWNPFRSELAAQGFAGRLRTATDVAVTVVQAGPTDYRVGFGYRDEAERRALIERIESITGLELE